MDKKRLENIKSECGKREWLLKILFCF